MTRHISRLRASFLFLSLAICVGMAGSDAAWSAEADARFVAADVVKLRASPSRDGEVLANLRINTRVTIMPNAAAPAGWAKISVEIDPPLSGYAASAFLGAKKQTAGALLADYKARLKAGDVAGAKTAAERLAALEPGKTDHAERLKALYLQLGDAAGVRRIDDYLAGRSPKFIAYCPFDNMTPVLLAEYQPGRGIVPLLPTVDQGALRRVAIKTLARLKLGLQRGPVFKMTKGKSVLLDSASLLTASVVPPPNEGVGSNTGEHVVLGPRKSFCDGDRVISNEPMKPLRTEPVDGTGVPEFTRDLRDSDLIRVHSATAQRLPGGKPLISVEIEPGTNVPNKGVVPLQHERFWRLFDGATGERFMERGFFYANGPTLQRVNQVQWFGWERSGVRVGLVDYVTSFEKSTGYDVGHRILLVVVDEQGVIHKQDLILTWWRGA